MKRIAQLRELSREHCNGLVLAQKAKRAAAGRGESVEAVQADIQAYFVDELERHFDIEESLLAPALEAAGEADLAARMRDEHTALRRLRSPATPAELQQFGELLERHIRFEERELFVVAETAVDNDVLDAIAAASAADPPPHPAGATR